MFFTFIIFNFIFTVDFSLQTKLGDGRVLTKNDSNHWKPDSNEIDKRENVIKKSDLEELLRLKNQYIAKNFIEEIETHFALHFVPDWTAVNRFNTPDRQSVDIRRQKWNFILNNTKNSILVNRLNSELKKAGINRTRFCDDIAEIYFTFSDSDLVFVEERNFDKKRKNIARNPSQEKSINVLIGSIFNFKMNLDKKDDAVLLPKSLYVDLMRRDGHAAMIEHQLGQHFEDKIQRLKDAYEKNIQIVRDERGWADSDNYHIQRLKDTYKKNIRIVRDESGWADSDICHWDY